MARTRYALIKHDGTVSEVIVATAEFLEKADPKWRAQFAEIRQVDLDVERKVGPGARFDAQSRTFTPPPDEPAAAESITDEFRAKVLAVLAESELKTRT